MYRSRIWRKKRAPSQCPECGRVLKRDQVGDRNSFGDMLKAYLTEPRLILHKREPDWDIPCWYFVCPCESFGDELFRKDWLLSKVKKDNQWVGGTLVVPFGKKV